MHRFVFLAVVLTAICFPCVAEEPANLLRNGSFEGGLLYWHGIDPQHHTLIHQNAKCGEYALRIEKGAVMSAPFTLKRGEKATVSFWVRSDSAAEVRVQMTPSAREEGTRAKRLWHGEGTQTAKTTAEWSRVSFTWPADVPASGFWPLPNYMIQIEWNGKVPFEIDGVTVVQGEHGTADYVPRSAIEATADCLDLPGWAGAKANFLERGATVNMAAHVSNPGAAAREVTVRWQFFDYEGQHALSAAVDKKVQLGAHAAFSENTPLKLPANGCVIARLSVLDGDNVLDRSDFPLTSLPYPGSATKPDWRERFGGSFAGGHQCVEKFQKLGFGWIRWRPHMNGEDHLPQDPKGGEWKWTWFDKELDDQESHGCSSHCVLYPPPAWIMEKDNPLPKDMRWKPDDPRWDDLSIETVWDKFVKGAVTHYKGRSLVYEIENEPEFDKWEGKKTEYARFTIRAAKLIRQTNAQAKIMVDNVYGIPSSVNAEFLKAGGAKFIDIFSWHDYHAGWLTDATGIKRMRQNLDEAGGKHIEIWFNEGWAFTNTLVDEPPACTGLTCAQSVNAIADCVAELSANGQDKTILFHTASEDHGMSFWDYSGPGTMLWDWYNYPLPLTAMWNVYNHHIGISQKVGFVRPPGANFCIFDDQRNGRGVMIAYADRDSKSDVTVALPDFSGTLTAEDIMGNAAPAPKEIVLSKAGRAVILYSESKIAGRVFFEKLQPLDRKNASFISAGGNGGALSWSLPPAWEGKEKGQSDGSVAMADGKPVWKLEQLWPADWKKRENFKPMIWTGTDWNVKEGGFGGQPGAGLKDGALIFGTRAPHGKPQALRTAGLTFVAPKDGTYSLSGSVECRLWDGKNKTTLHALQKSEAGVKEIGSVTIAHQGKASLDSLKATLSAGDELCLLPQIDGAFAGGDCKLSDLKITFGSSATNPGGAAYALPASWEGEKKGGTDGNPILADGKPIWRIDRVFPDKHIMAENYSTVPWDGASWHPLDHEQGGQPSVKVENGSAQISVSGPWQNNEFQKIAGIVFITPKTGVYLINATASTKPWAGGAKSFKLAVLKKDTQRAAELKVFDLARDGSPVQIEMEAELTSGHELIFLPLIPDWNNSTTTSIEGLVVKFLHD